MATTAESLRDDQSAFEYDYETLRTTGVILAAVMFVAGILIALTRVLWNGLSHKTQKYLLRQYEDGQPPAATARRKADMLKEAPKNVH